jgi:HPP family
LDASGGKFPALYPPPATPAVITFPQGGVQEVRGIHLSFSQDIPPLWPFPRGWHEWARRIPDRYWAPTAAVLMLSAVAGIGIAAREPLLFASLGPSAYLAAHKPKERTSSFHNVFLGHMIGLGAGFLAVFLLHAWSAPVSFVNSYSIAPIRVASMALAVFLSMFADCRLGIDHAATEATSILVAMGFFRTVTDALMVVQGVAIIAILSELFRRIRAGQSREEFVPADLPAPAGLPDRIHP